MTADSAPGHELLLALTNPVEGKDDEFREWYWGTHIPEILQLPGFVAARRYQTSAGAHKYVTIYEVEGSAADALKRLYTSGLGGSDTIDLRTVVMAPLTAAADL
jgi:hypothetical protein